MEKSKLMMNDHPPLIQFLRALYEAWIGERPNQLAAALAYFGLFSIAPIIFLAFTVASFILRQVAVYSEFYTHLSFALGPEAAKFIQDAVDSLGDKIVGGSPFVTIISVIALFIAASGMFFQVQFALNKIFKSPPMERDQTINFILQRLFSFLMVLGVGLILILASISNVIVTWLGDFLGDLTGSRLLLTVLDSFTVFGLITLSFLLLYKILPDIHITWKEALPGAALAAGISLLAGMILGLYFRFGGVGSIFEAAGTIAIILIASFVFAQIFLFGSLFTREYMNFYGSRKITTGTS